MRKLKIGQVVLAGMFGILSAGFALADSCSCDSPCSGSVNCPGTGCYAYCEENPENSGRHVCVKGCSSAESASSPAASDDTTVPADTQVQPAK